MDGREAMAFPGSHYYLPRGAFTNLSPSQVASGLHAPPPPPPGMRPMPNPNPNVHHPQTHFSMADFGHSIHMGMASPLPQPPPPMEQPLVKKKRGRPRKYAPDGQVSLGLSPMPSSAGSKKAEDSSSVTDPNAPKRARGRPPGTGRKQRLANLEPSLTYEGRFEILSLGGSYLVNEEGGSKSRTGGLSVSLSGPEGHVIGGGIGMLIAASLVQVVACSFVYGGVPKSNNNNNKTIKQEGGPKEEHNDSEMETTPTNNAPEAAAQVAQQTPQNFSGQGMSGWPGSGEGSVSGSGRSLDSSRNLLTDIDLTRG
ncbi:hypothetical protein HID58_085477 [Brassica napus]|uniref:AT-hook motif nuclear-localized protein n=1 Tax=Brassica napus TaxID=3708 RepID=A0ABQ7XQ78_BRANA|nr:hypothetical protein HID58_085477 [Brassica napus]